MYSRDNVVDDEAAYNVAAVVVVMNALSGRNIREKKRESISSCMRIGVYCCESRNIYLAIGFLAYLPTSRRTQEQIKCFTT